ncbi:cytochrome P450 [Roseateles asaccharophilus]|uniref:Cytochrome P450 n=1 Tax=Roseateles asaccharophilus TaxID=582607 RepID=A0ABU2AEC9_9BURK|nr:cytochrome P450 [Roseateles asaccharophilus]MDR7335549.1 cytochrome P450 [Roseateles asaccharophilus]
MTSLTWNDLPAHPVRWWGLPSLVAMRRDYLAFVAAQRPLGDFAGHRLFNERAVDLFSPELVREAMVDHADALIRWERGPEVFEGLMGKSVLVTEGDTWQRQRRMLMQAFTPKRVAGYAALMTEAAATGLDAVRPGEVAMDALFSHLTMDVISRTLFSAPIGTDTAAAARAVQVLSETALAEMFWPVTLPDWLPLPGKAAKRHAERLLHGLLRRHIDSRRSDDASRGDLLGMLLALRDEATGEALSPQEVYDQCMVSFQAGHETSATALLWWSWLLATHPDVQQRVRAEVDAVLQGRVPTADDATALPWLSATLKEAMRLYPPVAALLTRRLTRDITLAGVHLPARTLVRVTPWLLHRDPRWWPEEPLAFKPERFLGDAAHAIPRGAYIPFGLGPRVCLGQHFAVLEMTLIAALLLQRFELAAAGDAPVPRMAVTLRPEAPLRLRLTARRAA